MKWISNDLIKITKMVGWVYKHLLWLKITFTKYSQQNPQTKTCYHLWAIQTLHLLRRGCPVIFKNGFNVLEIQLPTPAVCNKPYLHLHRIFPQGNSKSRTDLEDSNKVPGTFPIWGEGRGERR